VRGGSKEGRFGTDHEVTLWRKASLNLPSATRALFNPVHMGDCDGNEALELLAFAMHSDVFAKSRKRSKKAKEWPRERAIPMFQCVWSVGAAAVPGEAYGADADVLEARGTLRSDCRSEELDDPVSCDA
jgi:hypothetical protein